MARTTAPGPRICRRSFCLLPDAYARKKRFENGFRRFLPPFPTGGEVDESSNEAPPAGSAPVSALTATLPPAPAAAAAHSPRAIDASIIVALHCAPAPAVRALADLCRASHTYEPLWAALVRARRGRYERTALMASAFLGNPARVAWLIARGAPVDATDAAAYTKRPQRPGHESRWWQQFGIGGRTALHWAAERGCTASAGLLLAAGADVDAVDGKGGFSSDVSGGGCTPLTIAAFFGHASLVTALLAAGAKVGYAAVDASAGASSASEDEDSDESVGAGGAGAHRATLAETLAHRRAIALSKAVPPLLAAVEGGHAPIVSMLIAAGASLAHHPREPSYLAQAVRNGNVDVVRALLAAEGISARALCPNVSTCSAGPAQHLDFASGDSEHWSLLHVAALACDAPTVRALLAAGADVGARARDGATPLHAALRSRSKEDGVVGHAWTFGEACGAADCVADTVAALLAAGADARAVDDCGRTPINLACGGQRAAWGAAAWHEDRLDSAPAPPAAIAALLDALPDVRARDKIGWAPLGIACAAAKPDAALIRSLLAAGARLDDGGGPVDEYIDYACELNDASEGAGPPADGSAAAQADLPCRTAIFHAVRSNSRLVLPLLLQDAGTPLAIAALDASERPCLVQAVEPLLVSSATMLDGDPALLELLDGAAAAVRELAAAGARIDVRSWKGSPPLEMALSALLSFDSSGLRRGFNPSGPRHDKGFRSFADPGDCAAIEARLVEVVRALLDARADVRASFPGGSKFTPLMMAAAAQR
jgi:ankyrin repeat protein